MRELLGVRVLGFQGSGPVSDKRVYGVYNFQSFFWLGYCRFRIGKFIVKKI